MYIAGIVAAVWILHAGFWCLVYGIQKQQKDITPPTQQQTEAGKWLQPIDKP